MTMWRMLIECWIPEPTNTHSEYIILLFHFNTGCTNAPQCYVIRTLPVLLSPEIAVSVSRRVSFRITDFDVRFPDRDDSFTSTC